MNVEIITIDRHSPESDLRSCADLLLDQMRFINSKSSAYSVKIGLKLALDNPEISKIFAARNMDNEIVGIVFANKGTSIEKAGYYLWINEFQVKSTAREKGVGTNLLNYILNWCIVEGYKGISLVSSLDNEIAKDLYHKFGFESERVLLFDKIFEFNQ